MRKPQQQPKKTTKTTKPATKRGSWSKKAKAALEKLPGVEKLLTDCSSQNLQLTTENATLKRRNDALLADKDELLQRVGYLNDQFNQLGDAHKAVKAERDDFAGHNKMLADKLSQLFADYERVVIVRDQLSGRVTELEAEANRPGWWARLWSE